ncbi:MAG TPA: phosphate ABC transporter permease subunit PstC, partial [Fimbriimonadaceae bacterium]|nr:phosphate ABC transporter permease subunit PstC [Fimbriimonadaceae bacterium]
MALAEPIGPRRRSRASSLAAAVRRAVDRVFTGGSFLFGLFVILVIGWIGARLFLDSAPTRERFGLSMLTETKWDVPHQVFGAATFIFGTLASSLLAMVIAVPIGVGAALFLTEVAPRWLASPISFVIELLAAVPSVVFGLWGFRVLCPFLQAHASGWLHDALGANPLFGDTPTLNNVLAAGFILAIMVIPFITAVSREVVRTVPSSLREASMGLGGTRWETIRNVVLPSAKAGISGACILGLGRAVGETMAVVLVIGNNAQIKTSLLQPAYTMSGVLANEFNEALIDKLHMSALLEVALILFVITLFVNVLARLLIVAAKGEMGSGPNVNPTVAKLRRATTTATDWLGKFGATAVVAALVGLQVVSDLRADGIAALGRGFEIFTMACLAGYLVFRFAPFDLNRFRRLVDRLARVCFTACGFFACFALGAVLYYVTAQGIGGLSVGLFTQLPRPAGMDGGGLENAMLGTVMLVGIGAAAGIPIGLLAGTYVAEFSHGRFGGVVRFAADVLNGIPSVVIGMFAYAAFVLPFGHFSAWAGGLSLGIIMVPTVARTTEDMLRLVPGSYREAALGLGASRAQAVRSVIFPAAKAGIVTGIMLGIARIAG